MTTTSPTTDHDHDQLIEAFGLCPICEQATAPTSSPAQGEALADEAITSAGAAAPAGWTEAARAALVALAHSGEEFTTDALWACLPSPPEPRAMGAVIRWGVQQGLIVDTGRARKSTRPECHARPVTIWTSTD